MCDHASICRHTCRPRKGGPIAYEVRRQLPPQRLADRQGSKPVRFLEPKGPPNTAAIAERMKAALPARRARAIAPPAAAAQPAAKAAQNLAPRAPRLPGVGSHSAWGGAAPGAGPTAAPAQGVQAIGSAAPAATSAQGPAIQAAAQAAGVQPNRAPVAAAKSARTAKHAAAGGAAAALPATGVRALPRQAQRAAAGNMPPRIPIQAAPTAQLTAGLWGQAQHAAAVNLPAIRAAPNAERTAGLRGQAQHAAAVNMLRAAVRAAPSTYFNVGAFAAPTAAAPGAQAASSSVVHMADAPAAAPDVPVAARPAPAAADVQPFPDASVQINSETAQSGWMPAVGKVLTVTVVLPTLVILHAPVGWWAAGVIGAAVFKRVLGGQR